MPAVAPMPSASETMAMAVTKGVLKSVRMANLRLRIQALDEPTYCGVYRLSRIRRFRLSGEPTPFRLVGSVVRAASSVTRFEPANASLQSQRFPGRFSRHRSLPATYRDAQPQTRQKNDA